jgi:predicted 2-oxoglutarate/Fe(II)-dependent dioxygenase YbiX/peroxiredoxin
MDESGMLGWGEQAPWFKAAALDGSPTYAFETVAGRFVLLLFFNSAGLEPAAKALKLVQSNRALFDDNVACFFGVTTDPGDARTGAIGQQLPGIRYFLDYDGAVSRLYGALTESGYRAHWVLLDARLRVLGRYGIEQGVVALMALKAAIAEPCQDGWAPVLEVPNVFESDFCSHLIALFDANGGHESGFMREVDGKTILVMDPAHKQRRDFIIQDEEVRQPIADRIQTRLIPAIARAFQFEATRMERYLIGCYMAGAGHFRPHRDNTTKGTAHRQFAVTINLNAGGYDGGDLRFPEFGERTYCAPTGGAIVFSCALLHEATPVTRGKRYAFLPFLYDENAALLRERNNPHLGSGIGEYHRIAGKVGD